MRLEFMRKTDLALRALKHLEEAGGSVLAADLATTLGSTRQFMPQVLAPLVRAGWVSSVPGPGGGYRLATDLEQRTLLEVIELIEGPTDDGRCVLSGPCPGVVRCVAHDAWSDARRALLDRLAATPVASMNTTRR
jgi:Rrf2 family transcriptional regulator, iron-sulfur cluster assembly transcription factor